KSRDLVVRCPLARQLPQAASIGADREDHAPLPLPANEGDTARRVDTAPRSATASGAERKRAAHGERDWIVTPSPHRCSAEPRTSVSSNPCFKTTPGPQVVIPPAKPD